jgi:hypothetical protein
MRAIVKHGCTKRSLCIQPCGNKQPQETTRYIPENEDDFLLQIFVCYQIITIITHILYCAYICNHLSLLMHTGYVMHQQFNIQQLYALPTLYLCVLYLSEKKTVTCATYSINWLVFIIVMKSVYCAVRTASLNKAVCVSSLEVYPTPPTAQSNRFQLFHDSVR